MQLGRRAFLEAAGGAASIGFASVGSAQEANPTIQMITEDGEYYFDPIGVHIQPGDTVTFENASGSHSATAYQPGMGPAQVNRIPDGADGWDSGTLTEQGATFNHTFDVAGTYDYFCIPHKTLGMVGRIVVGEPGGPADGSMPPDGDVPTSESIIGSSPVSYEAFTAGSVTGRSSNDQGDGIGAGSRLQPLVGAGLLSGLTILAAVVYKLGNTEGERYRVGSRSWRQKYRSR